MVIEEIDLRNKVVPAVNEIIEKYETDSVAIPLREVESRTGIKVDAIADFLERVPNSRRYYTTNMKMKISMSKSSWYKFRKKLYIVRL